LRLLDHFQELQRRHQTPGGRQRGSSRFVGSTGNNAFSLWATPQQMRGVQIDFPPPNEYYDLSSLQVLRSAFEIYTRDDLLSDVRSQFRARVSNGTELERLDALLALCYLDWWSDDKDDALKMLEQAAKMAKGDTTLKLLLAELRERRNELDDALAVLDSV